MNSANITLCVDALYLNDQVQEHRRAHDDRIQGRELVCCDARRRYASRVGQLLVRRTTLQMCTHEAYIAAARLQNLGSKCCRMRRRSIACSTHRLPDVAAASPH